MDNIKKFESFLDRMQGLLDNAKEQGHIIVRVEDIENAFPELTDEESNEKHNGGIVMEDFNDGNGFYKVNLAYLNKEQVEEIEELVKRWNLQPKGNEDESIISDLLDYFDEDKCLKHEVNDVVKWLKTIKPQPKQEWGEEDEKRLKSCLNILQPKTLLGNVETINTKWLKSLKDRYTWRPSNEQIDTLEHFVRSIGESGYASLYDNNTKLLYSLLEQLKKLKA